MGQGGFKKKTSFGNVSRFGWGKRSLQAWK
jgi:hypothetical protein